MQKVTAKITMYSQIPRCAPEQSAFDQKTFYEQSSNTICQNIGDFMLQTLTQQKIPIFVVHMRLQNKNWLRKPCRKIDEYLRAKAN